jgi:hypothetical protein
LVRQARNGDGIPLTTESLLIFTNKYGNRDDFWINLFFTPSTESQTAGRALLKRRDARVKNRDVPINNKVQPAQFAALQEWADPIGDLNNIKIPVLIVGGKAISSSTQFIRCTLNRTCPTPN